MENIDFKKEFFEDVKAEAKVSGDGTCASFVQLFARYLQGAEYLMDYTASFFVGTGKHGRKLRVDGFSYEDDQTMSLIIADFDVTETERVLTKTQARQLQEQLVHFIEDVRTTSLSRNLEMSRSCADLVDILLKKRKEILRYQLLIFTNANISTSITKIETEDIDGVPTDCQIWDVERLFKVCASDVGREVIEVDFKDYSDNGVPCLEASGSTSKDYKSYLCIIPGKLLADIYDKHGGNLLESNVRSFLSTKVAVNKKIQSTILNYPDRFFAYNNGISATAASVQIDQALGGKFLVSAHDFQIINGGQTTASLSTTRYKYKCTLDDAYVPMKLTVIEQTVEEEATDLIQNISRSSNSQNKVSDADFFSTHPFHKRMKNYSKSLWAKAIDGSQNDTLWFYERARGQYLQEQMRLTPSEKKKFLIRNPKNQLITKTDLAKVRNTWDGLPHIVSRGAQTNFVVFADKISNEWNYDDDGAKFNDKYFQETVALTILFRHTESMVSNQSWYQNSYRANIVTYTIALLRVKMKEQFDGNELDLLGIWTRQVVPDVIKKALTELSEHVYNKITDSQREVENVTQWCKREKCWKGVQEIDFRLPVDMRNLLVSKGVIRSLIRESKSTQRAFSDAEIMAKINEIPAGKWKEALAFATSREMLPPDEVVALSVAGAMPREMPTPAQCKKLIEIIERLEEEGFKR